MQTLTPKELELKALLGSLEEFAKETVKVKGKKDFGLSILRELEKTIFCNAAEFLSMREEWLETSRTNQLKPEMHGEIAEYLEVARQLNRAKDSFEAGKEAVKVLRELQSSLEYVVKGHRPEGFSRKRGDLASIESGFECLKRVLSDSDFKLLVRICALNAGTLFDELRTLIRSSKLEQYIIYEGKRACEDSKEQWRRLWKALKAIKGLYDIDKNRSIYG